MAYPLSFESIEDVLLHLYGDRGQWFGWLDPLVKTYDNLIIHDNDDGRKFLASTKKPTQEFLESELARLQEQKQVDDMREERNRLLAETDYFALSDVTMSPEMTEYRKLLRDLPSIVDINNPVFPVKP